MGYNWMIDPITGKRQYVCGLPMMWLIIIGELLVELVLYFNQLEYHWGYRFNQSQLGLSYLNNKGILGFK